MNGVRLTHHPMFFNSDKAVKKLGFLQTPIKYALIDEIRWLIEKGIVTSKPLVRKQS
jgi:dihydroflavonol-4-reductase